MRHTSNQALASQERNIAPPEDTPPQPPRRRLLIGWGTALAALAVSTTALILVIWLVRFPLAQFFLSTALAERGIEADFQVSELDLDHVVLAGVRVGSAEAPDAAAPTIVGEWSWNGLAPRLRSVHIVAPRLRLRLDDRGRVSAGALDHVGGVPSGRRTRIPEVELVVERGVVQIDAPFGSMIGDVRASGLLGRDFQAVGRLRPLTSARRGYALQEGAADFIAISRNDTIGFRFSASAIGLLWNDMRASDFAVRIVGRAPLDLSRYEIESAWRLGMLRTQAISADDASGLVGATATTRDDSLSPAAWRARARANAGRLDLTNSVLVRARIDGEINGRDMRGQGRWAIGGENFSGFSLLSPRATASGALTVDLSGVGQADANGVLSFERANLDTSARRVIDGMLPNLGGTPLAPTFAQANAALHRAGANFALNVPFNAHFDPAVQRLIFNREIAAHAASGLRFSLAPLRVDAPGLTMEWPNAMVRGAVDIEIGGGGAPTASLLLDTVNWTPGAPLEGDGTLTLSRWRTEGASVDADALNIAISIGRHGAGRVDLRGPARITGPFADGEVRDMVADLDIGVAWDAGWRIVANNRCLPIQLGGLNAAGLSFQSGRFSLCALDGALAGADAAGNLGGGFRIEALALNGRMADPDAQPARLTSASVIGRFHGAREDAQLSVVAATPSLTINVARERVLALYSAQLTASMALRDDWRIMGDFHEGALSDPALPGTVTAIAGRWSAAPESNKAVIRVDAGEALLTANRPADETERPLFHPLRIADFSAALREGDVDAQGAIVLAEHPRQLARFTAHHDVNAGVGRAVVTGDPLTFDRGFQPYQISEYARGFVENVRGAASLTANIDWTRDAISAHGVVHLDGVSLATSTIPQIQGVRGDIVFDDLFKLTTPPGQEITVATLNPGLTVHDGRVRFQLLPDAHVNIEQAEFAFASGILALEPTVIPLGAEETHLRVSMRDVDASALLATLNIPDLTATGRVDGSFPLLLTRRTALIQNGELHSQADGGMLAYVGHAGDNATGAARIAFDALRSFRYDDLRIALDGDLSGELVSSIQFRGHNSGRAVDLGPITPIPGLGNVTVRGVPFAFQVHVTAPFRSLAETAASISDPTVMLGHARNATETRPPVDQTPQAPR